MHDLLGFYPNFRPWFAKCYVPQVINKYITQINEQSDIKKFGIETKDDGFNLITYLAIKEYVDETKSKLFPSSDYIYPIKESELEEVKTSKYWKK